jgi:hypothetical protein
MLLRLLLLSLLFLPQASLSQESGSRKPDAPFSIVISADKRIFKVGSSVSIKVLLTNTSDQELNAKGAVSSVTGLDASFLFDVRDANGNQIRKVPHVGPEMGRPILERSVRPGGSFAEEQVLSKLFDFQALGTYIVKVSRRVSSDERDGVVKSNALTITVSQ